MAGSHNRVKQVFSEAMQQPAERRASFIERVCGGDAALLAEVRTLVQAMERASAAGFMSAPTVGTPAADDTMQASASDEGPGTRIGPYKILQLIGEGGFGSVFMAEQSKPVERRVALKIIKLGMDTRQVIARFEAERQALAMMDHPNIAKVLDAGATENGSFGGGRPYFVMELVKGDAITDYCDKQNLSIDERLELFAQVCNAVQHSHQKGIIHRDLKPSNILVSTQDGRPFAKVLDFGIAKATAARLTEKTLFTEHRTLIGTPEYMSPEQAEGSMDIDTRTDVYSLGVLLYELLTGATPFDGEKLRSAAYGELQRIIREVDPPNPSTRLSQNTETIGNVAAHRRTEPRKLNSIIRGELDWIVMKALEKDRARRYETASSLAADIARYLSGDAVVAAPPSAVYRFRTFIRRHRAAVLTISFVAIALLLGIAGTTAGMLRATRESQRAELERTKALTAASDEAKARRRAEDISDFVTTALRSSDANEAGGRQDTTILQAMDEAIATLDSGDFTHDPQTEAQLRETISIILRNNGDADRARSLAAGALDIQRRLHADDDPALARSVNMLAAAEDALGNKAEAERLGSQSLAMYQRLYPGDQQDVAALLNNVGSFRRDLGDAAGARPLLEQALAMRQRLYPGDDAVTAKIADNLAQTLQELGQPVEAERLYLQSVQMRQRLYPGLDHPQLAVGLNNLAGLRVTLGRTDEAIPLFEQALAMRRRMFRESKDGNHPAIAEALSNLAAALTGTPREAEAEPLIVEALEMDRRLFPGDHPNTAHALYTLAGLRLRLGRVADAVPVAAECVAMQRRLQSGEHIPLAMSLVLLGRARQSQKDWAGSMPAFDEGVTTLRRLMPDGSPQLARSLWQWGSARLESGDAPGALPLLQEAAAMGERFLPPDHDLLVQYRRTLAECQAISAPAPASNSSAPAASHP